MKIFDIHRDLTCLNILILYLLYSEQPLTQQKAYRTEPNNKGVFCIAPFKEAALIESYKKFARNFINDF